MSTFCWARASNIRSTPARQDLKGPSALCECAALLSARRGRVMLAAAQLYHPRNCAGVP